MPKFNVLDIIEMIINFIALVVVFVIVSYFSDNPLMTTFFIVVLFVAPLFYLTKQSLSHFFDCD